MRLVASKGKCEFHGFIVIKECQFTFALIDQQPVDLTTSFHL